MTEPTRNPNISLEDAMGVLRRQFQKSRDMLDRITHGEREREIELRMSLLLMRREHEQLWNALKKWRENPDDDAAAESGAEAETQLYAMALNELNEVEGSIESAPREATIRFEPPEPPDEDDDATTIDRILDSITGRKTRKRERHDEN